ncbi:MAG: hypothetical protein ACOC0N_12740 [Chroococcales cyanobacterium]
MKNNLSRAAKIFFNPETLFPFIIGTVFLSVLGNAVSQTLFISVQRLKGLLSLESQLSQSWEFP